MVCPKIYVNKFVGRHKVRALLIKKNTTFLKSPLLIDQSKKMLIKNEPKFGKRMY